MLFFKQHIKTIIRVLITIFMSASPFLVPVSKLKVGEIVNALDMLNGIGIY